MDLSAKKRMAAEILKVGVSRVRLDPSSAEKIRDAITRDAIRSLIKEGVIWAEPAKGISRGRWRQKRGKRKGRGSIKGAAGARMGKKERWVKKVRALRSHLKMLKDRGEITSETFNYLYRQVKGGQIRSVRHLKEVVKQLARRRS